jgi:hypothetical protein
LFDGSYHALVRIGLGEIEQFIGLGDLDSELVEPADDAVELGALASQFLGAFGVLPDGGVFELAQDLGQPLALSVIVKGTPSARWCAA